MMMRVGVSQSGTVAGKKTHAGKGSSSLSHHMWNLPQLPLYFSANLQRNKTSFLSIKNCV